MDEVAETEDRKPERARDVDAASAVARVTGELSERQELREPLGLVAVVGRQAEDAEAPVDFDRQADAVLIGVRAVRLADVRRIQEVGIGHAVADVVVDQPDFMRDVPRREAARRGRAERNRAVDLELQRGVGGHGAAAREARDDHALQLIADAGALLHVLEDVFDVLGRVERGPAAVGVGAGRDGLAHRQQQLVEAEVRDVVAEVARPAIRVLLTRQGGALTARLVRTHVQVVQIEPVVDDHEVAVPIRRKGDAEEAAGLPAPRLLVQV